MSQTHSEEQVISSFVLRCYQRRVDAPDQSSWRINVKHVQKNEELSFTSLEQAVDYMKQQLKE